MTIESGFRWQRGEQFANDVDVSGLYRELLEHGQVLVDAEIEVPSIPEHGMEAFVGAIKRIRSWQDERVTALVRRAAEDGYHVSVHRLRTPTLVRLDRALTEADTEGAASAEERAESLYRRMQTEGSVFTGSVHGFDVFAGRHLETLALERLQQLAAADGKRLRVDVVDDVGYTLSLRE